MTNYETEYVSTGTHANMKNMTYEKKIKTSNNYDKVTGINIKAAFIDGATREIDGDAIAVSLGDRSNSSVIKEALTGFTDGSQSLASDDRFFPLELNAQANELTLNFKGTAFASKYDGDAAYFIVTLRYESN